MEYRIQKAIILSGYLSKMNLLTLSFPGMALVVVKISLFYFGAWQQRAIPMYILNASTCMVLFEITVQSSK